MIFTRRIASLALLAALAQIALRSEAGGGAGVALLEVIARARTNNQAEVVALRVEPASAFASELRVRSGSLSMGLVAVEIEFADGGVTRSLSGETLAPGQQSRPIVVDSRRAMRRIIVVKRPGLRDGETELQVLGVPAKSPH